MRARALALLLALLAAACGGEEKREAPGVAPPPTAAPATPPPAATAPAPAPAPSAPAAALRPGDAAHGAAVYAQYCATCHGAGGKGDGPIAASLVPKPADHTDHAYIASLTDEHLRKVIEKGGASVGKSPLMAGWGAVLSPQDIADVVAHIRKLSSS
jgi:mono/diheme cytochrome c family protein